MSTPRTRVLMVCLGNICRSPTAEGVLRHLVQKRGLSAQIEVASCGTSGHWHAGDSADSRTISHAQRRGYDLSKHRARALTANDFETFDFLLAMDSNNLSAMKSICPRAHQHKLRLLMEFAPKAGSAVVPDPYYDGPEAFELVLDLCEKGCDGFLEHLGTRRAPSDPVS